MASLEELRAGHQQNAAAKIADFEHKRTQAVYEQEINRLRAARMAAIGEFALFLARVNPPEGGIDQAVVDIIRSGQEEGPPTIINGTVGTRQGIYVSRVALRHGNSTIRCETLARLLHAPDKIRAAVQAVRVTNVFRSEASPDDPNAVPLDEPISEETFDAGLQAWEIVRTRQRAGEDNPFLRPEDVAEATQRTISVQTHLDLLATAALDPQLNPGLVLPRS